MIIYLVSCSNDQLKDLDEADLNDLSDILAKYEGEDSSEIRPKKSILLPRIGSEKRSPIVFPRIGLEKKRGYHMPRIGRNLVNSDEEEQQQNYDEKRAFHMPRIGK